jgi:hypothetical protein
MLQTIRLFAPEGVGAVHVKSSFKFLDGYNTRNRFFTFIQAYGLH